MLGPVPERKRPQRGGGLDLELPASPAGHDQRRQVPGGGQRHLTGYRVQDAVGGGGHGEVRHRLQKPIEQFERAAGAVAGDRVGVQGGPQLTHQRRSAEAVSDHVADRHSQMPAGQLEDVIPVAAHLVAGRQVAGGGADPDHVDQPLGQQAALQHHGAAMLVFQCRVEPGPLDAGRRPGCGHVEQGQILLVEGARSERSDVQHADQNSLHDQRHAEQRADARLAEDRIEDVGVIDIGDEDGHALLGDPAGEALADRDADSLLHLRLHALGGASHELVLLVVEQQDGDGVHGQRVLHPVEQLAEEVLQAELGQRGVAQAVQRPDLGGRRHLRPDGRENDLSCPSRRPG